MEKNKKWGFFFTCTVESITFKSDSRDNLGNRKKITETAQKEITLLMTKQFLASAPYVVHLFNFKGSWDLEMSKRRNGAA